jgi:hypothetical protein
MVREFICDCCKKKVESEYELELLVKELRGKNIKEMCDKCYKPLEKYSTDLRIKMNKIIRDNQRKFIKELAIKNGVYL